MPVPVQDSPFLSNKSSGSVCWQNLSSGMFLDRAVFGACFLTANMPVPPREPL